MAGRVLRGSAAEALALARLATTKSSPCRVVLKIGNRNVKAAIIDDQRDLTVRTNGALSSSRYWSAYLTCEFASDRNRVNFREKSEAGAD